ncbi:MAG: DNA protecting protein DprA [Deltaproteobacteria bacterium RIFCSPLOWO2_02_FULL_44_10]|nr:MAG: DNA protecting protein DprA [Deltaproteobacteria bacterium RIFCSPHIGHO2_02_FULL_44_16]OGQ45160.1 MAG: DNA protecting protein DprA [Deltaproteobacteria bacterium RIFCSPLOWO2_02_FULL_44_10]
MHLSKRERLARLAFQHLFGTTPKFAADLIRYFGSAHVCFETSHEIMRPLFGEKEQLWKEFSTFQKWEQCEEEEKWYAQQGVHVLTQENDLYPSLVKEIFDPPLLLFAQGELSLLQQPAIALVGSRKASAHGLRVAYELAVDLASLGFVIVSGMAYGIDAVVHRGALSAKGKTIAVWGTGIDRPYPVEHSTLAHEIAAAGLLLTEFPRSTSAKAHHFPQRNRIISGLCVATIIVEAAAKSGSLITAQYALDQGRLVFALPGTPRNVFTSGNNRLLKEGALFAETADDILEHVTTQLTPQHTSETKKAGHSLKLPVKAKSFSLEDYVTQHQLSPSQAGEYLSEMILNGKIRELPGKRFEVVSS